jgi:phosphoglycolate phosphatase-like HAD superfamily hydrolase
LARWLSPVVSRDEVTWMKPRAEGILRVLSDWQIAPGSVLFVGDSRADVFGARAAGIRVAIIRGGECDETAFADAPPDHFVSGLDELATLIRVA